MCIRDRHNNEFQTLKNIKHKLHEHNLTILKADKGNKCHNRKTGFK